MIRLQSNLYLGDTPMRGHPLIKRHFLRTVSYLPNFKEPVLYIKVSPEDRVYCDMKHLILDCNETIIHLK